MHEVITLQFGEASNYLGTHFWNAQESYFTYAENETSPVDHDIHWRLGSSPKGEETFVPRTLIYDLKTSFGPLPKISSLYEAQENAPDSAVWRGQPVVQRQAEIPVSEYQQGLDSGKQVKLLPENVRFWSDFNRVFYHPRSSIQINDRDLRPSPLSLEHFSAGEELFASLDPNHEIIDEDLRPFVEEADSLQGFQIMTSMDDAWAGFAARYMEQLRDEYAKAVVISWGIQSSLAGLPLEKRLRRLANRARTLVGVGRESSLFVPLRVPGHLPRYLQLTAGLPWHRSALFATAVETAVLPSRLKAISVSQPRTFNSFVDTLNLQGTHPIATLELSARPKNRPKVSNGAPQTAPRGNGPHSSDGERESHEGLDMNLTSWAEEALVRRGHSKSAPVETFGQFMVSREAGEASGPQFDGVYIEESELEGLAVLTKSRTKLSYPLPDSFPSIYGEAEDGGVLALPVTTSLSTTSATNGDLRLLRDAISPAVAVEERETLRSSLADMADEYQNRWSSDSDSGSDD